MSADRTVPERLATLEAEQPFIKEKLDTMDSKLDMLVAAHNKGRGMATVGNLLLNAASAVAGVVAGIHWGRP